MDTTSIIRTWIIQVCLSDSGFGGDGGGLVLKYKDKHANKLEMVRQYPVDPQIMDPKQQAEDIYLTGVGEAEGNGPGTHHFIVYAHHQGEEKHFARKSFMVPVEDETLGVDEAADAKGLLAQVQRHLEVTQRTQASMIPTVMHAMQTVTATLAERLMHYEQTHLDMLKMQQELIEAKGERELKAEIELAKHERIGKLVERFGPIVLAKLLPADAQSLVSLVNPEADKAKPKMPLEERAKELVGEGVKGSELLTRLQGEGYDVQKLVSAFMSTGTG